MKRKGKIESVPDKIQLSNYLAYRRKRLGDSNNIEEVIQYIINHSYYEGIDEADLFFFGLKLENNKPVVGNGTDQSHFNACFSSIKLLKRLENDGQFHKLCFLVIQ